jgi:hypothetical protein
MARLGEIEVGRLVIGILDDANTKTTIGTIESAKGTGTGTETEIVSVGLTAIGIGIGIAKAPDTTMMTGIAPDTHRRIRLADTEIAIAIVTLIGGGNKMIGEDRHRDIGWFIRIDIDFVIIMPSSILTVVDLNFGLLENIILSKGLNDQPKHNFS